MAKQKSDKQFDQAVIDLETRLYTALQTYSNVHRGTGHYSMVTTALYEHAREVLLEVMELDKDRYEVIFGTPRKIEVYDAHFKPPRSRIVSSKQLGLPLGIYAMVVERTKLPEEPIFETGGGAVRMVYPSTVVWADTPSRFEAGTPSVINAIALAIALRLTKRLGKDVFKATRRKGAPISEILTQDNLTKYEGMALLSELRKTLVGSDVRIPTWERSGSYVNLDNGASTPTFKPIWDTVHSILQQPSSEYPAIIQEVRKICAEFLGAPLDEYEVIFTSNTTEAINIIAQNLTRDIDESTTPIVVTTLLEHNSNELPWRYFSGATVIQIPVDEEGFLDLHQLEELFCEYNQKQQHGKKRIRILALSGASNVLGTINDLSAISQIVHRYNAHLVIDGAQLVAHRQISMADTGIDYFAFSGHKIYAPFGSGALVVKKGLLHFDSSEFKKIRVSGEENVVGIATMGKALLLLQRIGLDIIEHYEQTLTRQTLQGLAQIPGVKVYGIRNADSLRCKDRLGIIALSTNTIPHNQLAKELAELGGIGVRNGCFCAHILVSRLMKIHAVRIAASSVLFKIIPELTSKLLPGIIRISLGLENNENDVNHFLRVLTKIVRNSRSVINRLFARLSYGTPLVPHTKIQDQMTEFTKNRVRHVYSLSQEPAFVSTTL